MDEYEDIETAARHRDWQGCARLMFLALFRSPKRRQRDVATRTLYTYAPIWKQKHPEPLRELPDYLLSIGSTVKRLAFPDLSEDLDLDPADAEFENGLIKFCHGVSTSIHRRYTTSFATAIRSAVTARQINKWLERYPEEYARWRDGRSFAGPTFLDDEAASEEAYTGWVFVGHLLREQDIPAFRPVGQVRAAQEAARLYQNWEKTVL